MFRKNDHRQRQLSRAALRRAVEGDEPDLSRLLDAAPEMMAEARRRRLSSDGDFFAELAALAGKTVPRLAAVTAPLLLFSTAIFFTDRASAPPLQDFRSLILASEAAQSDDLILKAIASAENDNG